MSGSIYIYRVSFKGIEGENGSLIGAEQEAIVYAFIHGFVFAAETLRLGALKLCSDRRWSILYLFRN